MDRRDPRDDHGKVSPWPNIRRRFPSTRSTGFGFSRGSASSGHPDRRRTRRSVLCMVGLFLMWAGWQGLDLIFPSSSGITPEVFEPREPIGPDTLSTVPWRLKIGRAHV